MVRPQDVEVAADPERSTSLQPTYEDSVRPDPLFDWELENDGDD